MESASLPKAEEYVLRAKAIDDEHTFLFERAVNGFMVVLSFTFLKLSEECHTWYIGHHSPSAPIQEASRLQLQGLFVSFGIICMILGNLSTLALVHKLLRESYRHLLFMCDILVAALPLFSSSMAIDAAFFPKAATGAQCWEDDRVKLAAWLIIVYCVYVIVRTLILQPRIRERFVGSKPPVPSKLLRWLRWGARAIIAGHVVAFGWCCVVLYIDSLKVRDWWSDLAMARVAICGGLVYIVGSIAFIKNLIKPNLPEEIRLDLIK